MTTDPLAELQGGWLTSGLPGIPCDSTYCVVGPDTLPPLLIELAGDWRWVPRRAEPPEWSIAGDADADQEFLLAAAERGLTVPRSLGTLLASPELRDSFRSGTACWWSLAADALTVIPHLDIPIVRFLTDQQDCAFWYLVLDGRAEPPVIASFTDLAEVGALSAVPDDVWLCAPSFEAFMYRFWLENEIAFRDMDGKPLTPAQSDYLAEARRLAV